MDGEGLFVPKMHAILHMLSFMVLFGSPDNARLGDQEKDHQPYVKKAVRRTRQWETTFEDEVLGVADRIDAMLQITSDERAALSGRFRCTWSPFETVYAFFKQTLWLFQSMILAWQKFSPKGILILSPDLPFLFKTGVLFNHRF